MFGEKKVSDSMLAAVRGVMSAEQKDSEGGTLETGDSIRVSEGDHAGMTGTITGFNTSGRSQVQLNRGRHVEISNEMIINESKKLDAVGDEDDDIDNDGDSDESDDYLAMRRKKIKKNMKEEDCPCCDGECKCKDDCPNCDCGDEESNESYKKKLAVK